MMSSNNPVSIVIPVFNEAKNLPVVVEKINQLFMDWRREHEVIFVDDGSSDGSTEYLRMLPEIDSSFKVVRFLRNFGQQAAITAGFEYTHHDIVIVMDADLQVEPADIPKLVEKLEEGYDVVAGYREFRAEKRARRFVSWLANRFLRWYFKLPYRDIGCGLQAFRKRFLEGPERFSTMYGHAAIFAVWRGGRFTDVPIANYPRVAGKTKYRWISLLELFLDILITFNISPIQMTVLFLAGSAMTGFGFLLGFISLIGWIFSPSMPLIPFILSLFSIMVGMQLISMGFINERVSRIDRQIQKTPMFVVDEVITSVKQGDPE